MLIFCQNKIYIYLILQKINKKWGHGLKEAYWEKEVYGCIFLVVIKKSKCKAKGAFLLTRHREAKKKRSMELLCMIEEAMIIRFCGIMSHSYYANILTWGLLP